MGTSERVVTLVTGSARGLGLCVARHLRERGDQIHVVWRTENERARALRKEFGERAHRADLVEPAEAADLVAAVAGRDGRLDHVVHAVGEYASGSLEEIGARELEGLWRSNVLSSLHVFDACRPHLRESRGSAVFFGTSGLAGFRARRTTAAYCAAKSALLVLVRSWALEEAPHGVRVNLLSPGHVPHPDAHPDTQSIGAKVPLGRKGTPEDVARAARFLTSEDAAHTTGTDLYVGGGWML